MKKLSLVITFFLVGLNANSEPVISKNSYHLVSKVVNDAPQLCGIDINNNLTILSVNLSNISISFMDNNGVLLPINEVYRGYSSKAKLFIYKYNLKSYPKNIKINNSDIGECK